MSEAAQTNGYNAERCIQVLDEIDASRAEIRRLRKKANDSVASEIAGHRGDIGAKIKEAKSAWGIPTTVLKTQMKIRELDRKKNETVESLEEDDRDELERFRESHGPLVDLPLGLAALGTPEGEEDIRSPEQKKRTARAGRRKQTDAAMDSVADNGAETLTLKGKLHPFNRNAIGGLSSIELAHSLRRSGQSVFVTRGDGTVYGFYAIENVQETHGMIGPQTGGVGQEIAHELKLLPVGQPGSGAATDMLSALISLFG